MQDKKQILTYVISGIIAVLAIVCGWELAGLLGGANSSRRQPETIAEGSSGDATVTNDEAAASSSEDDDAGRLANEVTDLMLAFGIEDALDPQAPTYAETDVETLSLENVGQVAPLAGTYKAVNLFEQGVEKDLAALESLGRSITITADGNGNGVVNFLGLEFEATYDDHYLYMDDGTKMAYYYDGQVITAAAHRIELDLVRVE